MELQAADELIEGLVERLRETASMIQGVNLSAQKERRQFETRFLRLFSQRQYHKPNEEGGHDYSPVWLADEECPVALQRLAVLFTRDLEFHENQLRVKPSMKSTAPGTRLSHFDSLKRTIRRITFLNKIPTLREVIAQYGYVEAYESAVSGVHIYENLFALDLLDLLRKESVPRLESWLNLRERWPLEIRIRLSCKLYLSRMERRTFGSDSLQIRSLVGSIVHALLLPKGKFDSTHPYGHSIPTKGRNVLSFDFSIAWTNEYTMIYGDISSFTSSFSNLWVLLLELIHGLETAGVVKKIIVDVGGSLVETNLVEVLRLFLYLGAGAGVIDGGEQFFPKGAILGVAGVDTLAKVLFGLLLESICATTPGVITARAQAGGDDFYIGLVTSSQRPESRVAAIDYIRNEVEKVVGRLKVLEFETLEEPPVDFVSTYTFCKKHVRVVSEVLEGGRKRIRIQSQWSLPFLGILVKRPAEEILGAFGVWSTILHGVPWVPEHEFLCDMLFALYAEGGNTYLSTMKTMFNMEINIDCVSGFTFGALEILSKVEPLFDSDGEAYRMSSKTRLSSVESGRLESLWAEVNGRVGSIIARRGEISQSSYSVPCRVPSRLVLPDKRLVDAYAELKKIAENLDEEFC